MARIEEMLRAMKEMQAVEVYLSAGNAPCVELRGASVPLPGFEAQSDDELRRLLKGIVPETEWSTFERSHDASFTCGDGAAQLLLTLSEHRGGIGAVVRLLQDKTRSLTDLSAPPVVHDLCHARGGIIVVSGPAGAGKSTLLSALVDGINEARSGSILTLVERLEGNLQGKKSIVQKRQINPDPRLLEEALRATIRQNTDVVLLDPFPLREEAGHGLLSTLLAAAEAGILCLVGLRAASAHHAIESLVACFPWDRQQPARRRIGSSLRSMIWLPTRRIGEEGEKAPVGEILTSGPGLAAAVCIGSAAALMAYQRPLTADEISRIRSDSSRFPVIA